MSAAVKFQIELLLGKSGIVHDAISFRNIARHYLKCLLSCPIVIDVLHALL
jgi:hypothetical protein